MKGLLSNINTLTDVTETHFFIVGKYAMQFTVYYSPTGKLLKIINHYDREVLYQEDSPVKRKEGIRKVNETGS